MIKPLMEIKTNKNGDTYTQSVLMGEFIHDKKVNMEYWDTLDTLAKESLENFAHYAGIDGIIWAGEDDCKEIVEALKNIVEKRFEVKFPYVDENY